jgi:aspartyl-tRNA(Asn)/glutamyl-tRNA(Gln) amidotransferase subunit A
MDDSIFFSSIAELAAQIRARRISSVELTEGYLARLEKYGATLGAVVTIMRESALQEARAADEEIRRGHYRGALHGIPYGAKDLLATKNAPTTWGATPYKNQRFDADATIITRLREAGAILVAKLAMIELAGGMNYNEADASLTGACKTPWNLKYWSGGSSSGPGSATAAALVAFAIGSETSGSIITPSAFCGVSGLRPTYGAVSRHGAMALAWTLDKLGPMCRTADCCGHVLAAIAGRDALDPTSRDFKFTYPNKNARTTRRNASNSANAKGSADAKRLRVAVMKNSYEKAQAEVRANFLQSLEVLKRDLNCDVVMDVPLPDFQYGLAVRTIVNAEGASAFRDLIESGRVSELASPEGRTGGYAGLLVSAVDYLHAMRMRAPMQKAWAEFFKQYDLLVAPSRATVSYPIDKPFDKAYPGITAASPIGASNVVGVPAISVPNGFGIENLPTGIQFISAAFNESLLVEIANQYQRVTDWHKRKPPLTAA